MIDLQEPPEVVVQQESVPETAVEEKPVAAPPSAKEIQVGRFRPSNAPLGLSRGGWLLLRG